MDYIYQRFHDSFEEKYQILLIIIYCWLHLISFFTQQIKFQVNTYRYIKNGNNSFQIDKNPIKFIKKKKKTTTYNIVNCHVICD